MGELRRTPLHEQHLALGARMVPFAGYEMPVQYTGIIEEHAAVRESAGVFDVCHMAQFRVFGFGAFDFLQGLLTNDLRRISELGSAQYTLMCDEDGGIIDDLIVYHTGDIEYLMIANAANRQAGLDWMRSHAPEGVLLSSEESGNAGLRAGVVELADESDRTALIALQGPDALRIIGDLAGEGYKPPSRFSIAEAVLDSVPVLVSRTGYTGEDGVELLTHSSMAAALWRAILSFPEVTPCGIGARDTLRLEMGYPLHGSDMDRGVDPVSAGLSWTLSLDEKDFIGRDAIVRIKSRGPDSRLVGLELESGIARPGYRVLHDGIEVGKVASGTYSPTLQRGIATAYVPTELSKPGTPLEVEIRKKTAAATVVKPPFVKNTSLTA